MTSISITRTWTVVLFDLDGTIIDSGADICAALAETFTQIGITVPPSDQLQAYVGPPLLDSLMHRAGLSRDAAWHALVRYREIYRETVLHSPVFPGVAGLIESLQGSGMVVALATSKPESVAKMVLENAELTQFFTVVAGSSDDEKLSAKADIVAVALRRLEAEDIDVSRVVMVGDRDYDVIGAAANGVPTILVEWGYGSPTEAIGAHLVVHSVDQLRELLLGFRDRD